MTPNIANVAVKKRRAKRFSGIGAAASALHVTRGHLWAVLTGRRESKPLMARYHALDLQAVAAQGSPGRGRGRKYMNSPIPQPPSINLAAAQNLQPAVFAMLEKLRLNILIVKFLWSDKPEITARMNCGEELGELLAAARAGQYDATFYHFGEVWHFFYSKRLAKAVPILRDAIAERGVLAYATILQAEEHDKLRVWYPPTAEEITAE